MEDLARAAYDEGLAAAPAGAPPACDAARDDGAATVGAGGDDDDGSWGHYADSDAPPADDDAASVQGEAGDAFVEEAAYRFDSSNFGACGARCAYGLHARTPAACTAALGFDELGAAAPSMQREGCPRQSCDALDKSQNGCDLVAEDGKVTLRLPNASAAVFSVNAGPVAPERLFVAAVKRRRRRDDDARAQRRRVHWDAWDETDTWECLRAAPSGQNAPGVGEEDVEPSLCTNYRDEGVVLNPTFAPRVATRFFPGAAGGRGLTVALALGAVRVVATPFEKFAQYELRVSLDGRAATSAWRRYSAFRAFAAALTASAAPVRVVRTLSAWADAQDAKKVFRCTHPAYLLQRYYHFEHVLREALFEIEAPDLLLSFFATQPRRTRSAEQLAGRRPFARSAPVAIEAPPGGDDAASAAGSASHRGTPAPRSTFLGAFLGVRDDRRSVPAH